jgi:RNA polymerase sigma factor (sigma-70 family)
VRDDPTVIALVNRAAVGDRAAWYEIVERYSPLVWSICVRYRLDRDDADEVGQTVWLRLVEKLGSLRYPAALPGWLATTTRHECLRVLRVAPRHVHAGLPPDDQMPPDVDAATIEAEVLAAERNVAVRAAFAELPPRCRELLSMMICDPPCRYQEISAALDMPVGSIGPMRTRCLERIRRSPHIRSIADDGTW